METLGVITARSGSKSIFNKSIALCAGKPLIEYTIEAAKNALNVNRLVITTDSEEFAEIARSKGVEVPFIRPAHLAEDLTPDLPVFIHVLEELKKEGYRPDMIVHLRPTTPLKRSSDIDAGIAMLLAHPEATSVRSVCEPLHSPFKMFRQQGDYLQALLQNEYPEVFAKYPEAFNMPRQLLPKVLRHSGYVDVIRTAVIEEQQSMSGVNILPLHFDAWRDIDIDTPRELAQAAYVIEELRKEGKEPWM